jgi:predicted transcriptional regulator
MTLHQKASKQHAVLQRRLRVAELAAQGRTQLEIALELGVSQPTICADLDEIHAQWRQAAGAETADRIAREIAMIEEVRRVAWQAWAKSQQDAERERVKTTTTADEAGADAARTDQDGGVKVEKTKERRTQSGDSKLLQTVLDCSELILKTLGAFKTKPAPPVNTWDTVLKALYESQANGDAEDDATRIQEPGTRGQGPGARERLAPQRVEGRESRVEQPERLAPQRVERRESRVEQPERLAPQRVEGRESRVEQPGGMPGASVCDRSPGEIAGDVASRGEPVSDPEPAAQVPPGREQTPDALGTDDPDDWRQTALRIWNRLAGESSDGERLAPQRVEARE